MPGSGGDASHGKLSAADQAERSVARLFLATRAGEIVFSTFMVISDRHRFRRPGLQMFLLGGTIVESAWMARRLLRAGSYRDRTALWVDTTWSAVGLVLCGAGLGPGTSAPWMKNIVIGAALGATSSDDAVERAQAMGVLGVAAVVTGVRAEGRDSHVAGWALGVNDVINWTGSHIAVSTYLAEHRRQAGLQDAADRLAIEQATKAAAAAERTAQHRSVHRRTVEVLRTLAQSDDRAAAGELARREAGRLRHILRTKGDDAGDGERALHELADSVSDSRFHVELVTAEMQPGCASDSLDALLDAARIAIQAAKDLGEADRVVVRAATEADSMTVTVRHHGRGFAAGTGSQHEALLASLDPSLAAVGGRATVWSAEDRGVRVTLAVPAAPASGLERDRREPVQGVPDIESGSVPTRDHERAVGHRDVDRRGVGRFVRRAQHEIDRLGALADRRIGRGRPALQTGAQQRPVGDDANRGRRSHLTSMRADADSVLVRSDPIPSHSEPTSSGAPSTEAGRADRTIATLFMSWRFSGLATGLAALVAGRKRYRSQSLAAAQMLGAAAESVWLARRFTRRGYRFDSRSRVVDPATAVATLFVGRANLAREDRLTWINWAPWSFAANATSGRAIDGNDNLADGIGAVAIIAAAAAAAADRAGDRIVNTVGMSACFAGGQFFARQVRGSAARLEAARTLAIDQGRRLAVEQERSRQLRLLHDSALQTLEAVAGGRYDELEAIRTMAADERRRLELEIVGSPAEATTLEDAIAATVDEHRARGLQIELVVHATREPPAPVVLALRDACNESLTNVRKHAGTARAEVVVESASGLLRVTVRDDGSGFEPAAGLGFGTTESILRRMAEVGGGADIDSAPEKGTRVSLWGPE